MSKRMQLIVGLMILCIVLVGIAGCAPPNAQPTLPPTTQPTTPPTMEPTLLPTDEPAPTLQPGWETHTASTDQGQCGYAIDHPSDIDAVSQGTYNWLLTPTAAESGGPVPSFIYISVIPDGFQSSEPGVIYNYDPAETQTLLSMQVGESRSLRDDAAIAASFTYTRLPDAAIAGQTAQMYENIQPWEFPQGTKEIRYYLKGNGCTYLIGGYLAAEGSAQPAAIGEELFDQIMNTFRLVP